MMFIPEEMVRSLTETGGKRSQMIKWYFDTFEYVAGLPRGRQNHQGPARAQHFIEYSQRIMEGRTLVPEDDRVVKA